MNSFLKGTTVICSIEVRDTDGNLVSPNTSMKITISLDGKSPEVAATDMTPDNGGKYHYDFVTTAQSRVGSYRADYVATDNARISTGFDWFMLI